MSSIDSALLFWAIALGSLSTDTILLALLYRMDRHRQQLQQELATVQQQAAVIQRSAQRRGGNGRRGRRPVYAALERNKATLEHRG